MLHAQMVREPKREKREGGTIESGTHGHPLSLEWTPELWAWLAAVGWKCFKGPKL